MEGGAALDESLDYLWRHDPNGRAAGTSKAEYARSIGITTTLGERNRRVREVSISEIEDALYHCSGCARDSHQHENTVR